MEDVHGADCSMDRGIGRGRDILFAPVDRRERCIAPWNIVIIGRRGVPSRSPGDDGDDDSRRVRWIAGDSMVYVGIMAGVCDTPLRSGDHGGRMRYALT